MGSLVISPDRIGPWAIGISYQNMATENSLELRYSSETTGGPDQKPTGRGCETFSMEDQWPGLSFMFEDGILTRIDLFDPNGPKEKPEPIKAITDNGIIIGDTIAEARKAFGDSMTIAPHPYLGDAGSYLSITPKSGQKNGMVFETSGQTITSLRIGDKNSVQYIEGCL